jgi:hypothetical protein
VIRHHFIIQAVSIHSVCEFGQSRQPKQRNHVNFKSKQKTKNLKKKTNRNDTRVSTDPRLGAFSIVSSLLLLLLLVS